MFAETTDRPEGLAVRIAPRASSVSRAPLTTDRAVPRRAPRECDLRTREFPLDPAALRALLAQLPAAVVLVDRSGRVTYTNAAARRLQARGVPSAWPNVAQLPSVLEWPVARALLTRERVRDATMTIPGTGGPARCMRVSITPVQSGDADGAAAVLTFSDVSDRRRWEAWEQVIASLARL